VDTASGLEVEFPTVAFFFSEKGPSSSDGKTKVKKEGKKKRKTDEKP
jgi:hypothetical protein